MKKIVFLAALLALTAGCSTVTAKTTKAEGAKLEKEAALKLKPGITSREAVISAFGAPAETVTENGEERLKYVYTEKQIKSYFGGTIQDEVTGGKETTTLEVVIKNNIVDSYKFKKIEE
ncbi:MAG: hypothetical protein HZB82_01685 [Deltaproteobacteria bacterium]|nr:hypothetical protein [Deltaproteobacteria bacterium]